MLNPATTDNPLLLSSFVFLGVRVSYVCSPITSHLVE